ncbi:HTH domain-containing protein [Rathayibacter sp. PhB1]|uniref:helix-turn-helix transcriptional regulator n=1 Tax=Rathayibacter sp. PhB1 TaxID=2485171 RepID=UPI001FB67BA4|nr:HTH domain-containing protein [Rathayibacter sp. PhB1]
MNRTDRLYGLVEELRAVSPRPRSARRLAERFEVSVRTIERDLSALQQSGLPIWAEPGRTGGYVIDASATLGPAGFTLDEALAVLIGLSALERSPFLHAARTAARKAGRGGGPPHPERARRAASGRAARGALRRFRRGASAKRIGARVVLSGTPPRPTRSPASASSARTSSARNHLETAPRLPCG